MATLPSSHIRLDADGRAWIAEANVKVIEVIKDKVGYGWDAEEIHRQYPSLSLAQIHAALCYYYDHQDAFDAEIAQDWQEYEEARRQTPPPVAREELLKRLGRS